MGKKPKPRKPLYAYYHYSHDLANYNFKATLICLHMSGIDCMLKGTLCQLFAYDDRLDIVTLKGKKQVVSLSYDLLEDIQDYTDVLEEEPHLSGRTVVHRIEYINIINILYDGKVITFRREDIDKFNHVYNLSALDGNNILEFLTEKLVK